MAAPALALLHVLVLVYWVGGDLGAFYSSFLLGDSRLPVQRRLAAAQVLAAVDMAPRSSLILALPTGVTLAVVRSWLELSPLALAAVWLGAVLWLCLAWAVHLLRAPPAGILRRADLVIRCVVLLSVLGAAVGILSGRVRAPEFIGLKLLLLAAALGTALAIRASVAGMGAALDALAREGASAAIDQSLARALGRARPLVVLIWLLVLAAAFVGLWKPSA